MSEKDIENSILDFLNKVKIFAFKVNTVGVYDPHKGVYRNLGKFVLKGTSDILGTLPDGRFLAIEVKTSTGKATKEQKAFINKVNSRNGLGFIARSIGDVIEKLKENGYGLDGK